MNKNKLFIPLLIFFFFFLVFAQPTYAFSLNDTVESIKNIFVPNEKKELKIDSLITLAPEGDVEKNGKIDAGDTVRFTYTISNLTNQDHSFTTINTNVSRNQLNFIHNIKGTSGLNDNGKTVTIPNLTLGAGQTKKISFDAQINYNETNDPLITTEADFIGSDKKVLAKSIKKEVKALRISRNKIPTFMKQEVKK